MLIVICVYSWISPRFLSASTNKKLSGEEKIVGHKTKKILSVNEDQVYILCHTFMKPTQSELRLLFYSVT